MLFMSKRRQRGSGSLKLRGRVWWICYVAAGRPIWESSHSPDKQVAENLLRQRIGEVAAGKAISPEKATIADLCALVLADYQLRKLRDLNTVEWRYEAHIRPAVGSLPASHFGPAQVRAYVAGRRAEKVSDATINRELAIIRRGFTLGAQEDPPLVRRVPKLPQLTEDNARQGFVEQWQYERLLTELPERLKALFVCAYHVGTRKGELRKIQWTQVDFEARKIHFSAAQTKGKTARSVPIYGEMRHWLGHQKQQAPAGCPWVFFYRSQPVGAHLDGWREACERAGVPDLLFHDLRRSAVRNMTRAGIPRPVAMAITGHKTESMYRRYDIASEADLSGAGEQMERYLLNQRKARIQRVK
jgi:integrase